MSNPGRQIRCNRCKRRMPRRGTCDQCRADLARPRPTRLASEPLPADWSARLARHAERAAAGLPLFPRGGQCD